MCPTYFFTCLMPDDFTRQWGTLQLNGLNLAVEEMENTPPLQNCR